MRRKLNGRDIILGAVIMFIGMAVGVSVSPLSIAERGLLKDAYFDAVNCSAIHVNDKEGKPAIILRANDEGNGELGIWDKDHKLRIFLTTTEGNAIISIRDKKEKRAISLYSGDKGNNIMIPGKWSTILMGIESPKP